MSTQRNSKLWGGILLLTGTTMGGGLLALPISTSETGFINALLLMLACWFLMTTSALLMLEVNLWLPPHTNIVSMAKVLLGPCSVGITWVCYLSLLYSIIAAYMMSGSDFLQNLIEKNLGLQWSHGTCAILFTTLLGTLVAQGIRCIDYINRGLMIAKLIIYILLVLAILPLISPPKLLTGELRFIIQGFTVVISAFSYANIVPSLRSYFQDDIASLRKAILIGSTIPLLCYILWNASVIGIIPLYGPHGLIKLLKAEQPTYALINQLNTYLNSKPLSILAHSFASVCVFTTFLTCSLGLIDFLKDGLWGTRTKGTRTKIIYQNITLYAISFLPPLNLTLFYPGLFIKALDYAGIACLILFVLLPVAMAWRGRYSVQHSPCTYRLAGGKPLLLILASIGILGIFLGLCAPNA